jgi:hypothetical protein
MIDDEVAVRSKRTKKDSSISSQWTFDPPSWTLSLTPSTLPSSPKIMNGKQKANIETMINDIPMVIKSMIITYFSFRSYICISSVNKHWQMITQRPESKPHHLRPSSFIIECSKKDHPIWLSRVIPHAPTTLIMQIDPFSRTKDRRMDSMVSFGGIGETLTSLSIQDDSILINERLLKWLPRLTLSRCNRSIINTIFTLINNIIRYRGIVSNQSDGNP